MSKIYISINRKYVKSFNILETNEEQMNSKKLDEL